MKVLIEFFSSSVFLEEQPLTPLRPDACRCMLTHAQYIQFDDPAG